MTGDSWFHNPAVKTLTGVLVSSVAAGLVSTFARHHAANWVPLAFILIVLVVAHWFGPGAGILSSLIAALVFATWLFAPVGDLSVQSAGARTSLGWMILAGTSLSFLLSPPQEGKHR